MKNAYEPCRYLEEVDESSHCAFFDHGLHEEETHKCVQGGWECYELPGGTVFNGVWMALPEFLGSLATKLPENLETFLPDKFSGDVLTELLGWDEPA